MQTPTPKSWIRGIHAYVPGKSAGDDGRRMIKLSANENPLGCSAAALAAHEGMRAPSLYPDGDSSELRLALGALHGIDPARIIMGTGSGELLFLAASAYAGPGDAVLSPQYAFSLYDIVARRCGAEPVEAPAKDYGTDVDALIAAVTPKTRVVFVANPNNPTGTFLPAVEMRRLHAALPPDVLLVIDQAYAEYVDANDDDGGLALADARANVLVTRTFSKAYGLAGVRIGWATGHADIIDALNRIRGAFNLSNEAQAMGLAAVGDQDFIAKTRHHNRAMRAKFVSDIATLGNHGIRAIPSEANFVLIVFDGAVSAETAYCALMEDGVIVRWLPNQGLPHALRITIGMEADMNTIVRTLRRLCGEGG